jgi:cell division protein FtsZ
MNVLAVCEKPQVKSQSQVIQFRPQEESVPAAIKVITGAGSGAINRMIDPGLIRLQEESIPAVMKVVSTGGAGGNALNRMIESGLAGVQFISINTDIQDLCNKSQAKIKLQIGAKVTGGRGAGGKPEKGEKAALEDQDAISEVIKGADMVFITAGMGGGTGTGSAPVIAKIAKESGALTVAVVTMPFDFEGRYRMKVAEEGIAKLRGVVDTLIVIPNQYLFKMVDNTTTWDKAYLMADEVLCRGVQGISEIITKTGFQNVDFADVEAVMKGMGDALMGIGFGSGENRAVEAVKNAIDNPLLEDTSIDGATGVLINIAGPDNITLVEIQNIIKTIKEKCDPEVNIIYGLRPDPELENNIQITVIATGFKETPYTAAVTPSSVKSKDADFIDYSEFVRMRDRAKRPEYLTFLPQKDYQDLDVPSIIRNHNFQTDENQSMDKAEKY